MSRGVAQFHFSKYNFDVAGTIHEVTKNTTADLKSGIPVQAVCNRLKDFEPPPLIKNLNRLEKISVAKRIFFNIL